MSTSTNTDTDSTAETSPITTSLLPTPIKGNADWRNYKAFRLDNNGVTVLVINDKESKTTAMSCIVEVGAGSDPRTMSGLAHFCEHMCFLGSEKYPGENEYKRYLASHGGRSNASTSMYGECCSMRSVYLSVFHLSMKFIPIKTKTTYVLIQFPLFIPFYKSKSPIINSKYLRTTRKRLLIFLATFSLRHCLHHQVQKEKFRLCHLKIQKILQLMVDDDYKS